jgi:hypothetical protein
MGGYTGAWTGAREVDFTSSAVRLTPAGDLCPDEAVNRSTPVPATRIVSAAAAASLAVNTVVLRRAGRR